MDSKSQKPRQRVSISDQKIFARILKIDYKVKPKHQHKGEKVLEITQERFWRFRRKGFGDFVGN